MTSNLFLHVRSPKFKILPGEDDELANEGMYGKSFALYLQTKLAENGFKTPCVVSEDWGWWVEVAELGFTCGIGVYGMQIDDTEDLDLCVTILTPKGKKWNWGKFRFIDVTPSIERLHETIRHICDADEDVTVVCESEEFPLG